MTEKAVAPSQGPERVNGRIDPRIWWGVAAGSGIAVIGAGLVADALVPARLLLGLLGAGGLVFAGWRLFQPQAAAGSSEPALERFLREDAVPRAMVGALGEIVAANGAYRRIFALAEDAPLLSPHQLLGLDEGQRMALSGAEAAARAGKTGRAECRFRLADGAVRWLALTAEPLAGGADRFVWQVSDITSVRGRIEAEAEQGRELAQLIDAAPVGLFVADAGGRLRVANAAFEAMLGRPRHGDGTALTLADCLVPPLPPEGDPSLPFAAEVKTASGTRMPVRVTLTRVQTADGVEHLHGVVRALDTELALEDSLRRAEEQFRHFFDYAPIGIVVLDGNDCMLETNVAFRSIASDLAAGGGRPFVSLVREEDRSEVRERLAQVRRGGGGGAPIEVRLVGPTERVAQLFASRLGNGHDGISGLLVHVIDTTEQKSLEVQFAQSQKMQAVGQLAGGIAHDFNNLLTAMIGFCDLLLLRHQAGDQSFADIMQIKQNANRAANLVRQLLAFSRQQTLRPKVINITDVLAELSHLLRRLIGATIQLQMVHGRDLGLIKVDQGQLEQVIINLVVNARDAMPEGGTLTIRTANVTAEESTSLGHELMPAGEYVLVEVIDTGVGIVKEHLGKIFEPFFTTKPTGAGTGLGLSTVYGIVKQTGGFIFPFSQVGKGTTFKIYLPRHMPASGEEAVTTDVAEARDTRDLTGKGTVLLVEDEDAVRVFAARALRNKGYTVVEASSGDIALTELERLQGKVDVLVSDVVMPGVDGPTLAKRVRETHPDMKIIFISGYAEDAFRRNLDRTAEIHFLPKPFSLKQLAGKVKEVLTSNGD
ncbi:hybrid sensor histidine kinase/response regulator [Desertibaculum subflavum]|uniref:hybrid sensor histidine kinase/response regulator n=1 Tax=Desertibaculum subflavum TaxID=2268458 RepID=UPI0034D24C58